MKIQKIIVSALFFVLSGSTYSKQVSEGTVRVNNQELMAILFDDPALSPVCRQKISNAMQAMFYLNGQSFASGCWVPLEGEIHTQMTRYDTHETRSFVFSASVFRLSNSSAVKNTEDTPKAQLLNTRPIWCKNSKLAHEITICSDEELSSKEFQILNLYKEYSVGQAVTPEILKAHKSDFFKKIKACGSNKKCISDQQDARLNFYKSVKVNGQQ